MFSFENAYASGGNCHQYLTGTANLETPRFGGGVKNSPVQRMADLLLEYVPNGPEAVQVAIPTNLRFNPKQAEQFGDGQRNAMADFGVLNEAPFVAVLTRNSMAESSELAIIVSRSLPGSDTMTAIDVSIDGKVTTNLPLDSLGTAQVPVDLQKLAWDKTTGAKPVFFRPTGWGNWFSVQFPNPYITIASLVEGMAPNMLTLPDGRSIIDPLKIKGVEDLQAALKEAKDPEFGYAYVPRVHGDYQVPDGPLILTSNGGVHTRYRDAFPFKIVYLVKDPRNIDIESRDSVVSGTGPHYIGATAEIILNSLGQENLMTFFGVRAPERGPDGSLPAYDFTHQWIGTWLRPGYAFVSPQGSYHWHLNHLGVPVAAQVLTPPQVPSVNNHYGFSKK